MMQQPPVNCPRCESEQAFVPHIRTTEHNWQEEIVTCGICRYEQIIRYTTPELEELRKRLRKYVARRLDRERNGLPLSATLLRGEEQTRTKMLSMMRTLRELVGYGESIDPDSA